MGKKTSIAFRNVSKKFRLNRNSRSRLSDLLRSIFRKGDNETTKQNELWALKEINFELYQGECFGIIGANGAGKTSLLKLIAHVLEPTDGKIEINGKVGALIELGAGFHLELTGRQNIFLYGAILGLKKNEINSAFEEIVTFSGLKDFLDVPLKRYSTGMQARLGFSVAIFTKPQILLVDEVLAVGDASFQMRCMRRLSEMKKQGVGILFVSHDMTKIQQVCDRCMWLDHGLAKTIGSPAEVVSAYLEHFDREERTYRPEADHEFGIQERISGASIERVDLLNKDYNVQDVFDHGDILVIRVYFQAGQKLVSPNFSISFEALNGQLYTGCVTKWDQVNMGTIEGHGYVDLSIPKIIFGAGAYEINVGIWDHDFLHAYDWKWGVKRFTIKHSIPMLGRFTIPHEWKLNLDSPR